MELGKMIDQDPKIQDLVKMGFTAREIVEMSALASGNKCSDITKEYVISVMNTLMENK